jgi:hypothetical protein
MKEGKSRALYITHFPSHRERILHILKAPKDPHIGIINGEKIRLETSSAI